MLVGRVHKPFQAARAPDLDPVAAGKGLRRRSAAAWRNAAGARTHQIVGMGRLDHEGIRRAMWSDGGHRVVVRHGCRPLERIHSSCAPSEGITESRAVSRAVEGLCCGEMIQIFLCCFVLSFLFSFFSGRPAICGFPCCDGDAMSSRWAVAPYAPRRWKRLLFHNKHQIRGGPGSTKHPICRDIRPTRPTRWLHALLPSRYHNAVCNVYQVHLQKTRWAAFGACCHGAAVTVYGTAWKATDAMICATETEWRNAKKRCGEQAAEDESIAVVSQAIVG